MTAPDKIWADPDHWIEFPPDDFDRGSEYTEYTRTATIPAILAENERLREALEKIEQQSAYGRIDACNRLAIEALGRDQ